MKSELVPTKPRQTYHIAYLAYVCYRYSDCGDRVSLDGVAARGLVNGRDPTHSVGRDEVGTFRRNQDKLTISPILLLYIIDITTVAVRLVWMAWPPLASI